MAIIDRLAGFVPPAVAYRRAIQMSEAGKVAEAFPLMAVAARAGMADAEHWIARAYLEGAGVPPSRIEGARWLEQAAAHGHVDAQTLLAALYVSGLAAPAGESMLAGSARLFAEDATAEPDFAAALTWAKKAAEAGSVSGQAVLGYVLTCGPPSLRDDEAAHGWYERSAAAGCPEGCLGFALSLARRGGGGPDTQRRIAAEVRRAAEAGLPTAIYLLAVLSEHGLGVTRDPAAGLQLYRDAAEKGLPSAQFRLGLALIEGDLAEQDAVAGESWLRRASHSGNAEAAFALGERYSKSAPPDFAEAANWYRRAAEAGHQSAARALASLYLTGNGVAEDAEEGMRWLRAAANSGNRQSHADLANLVLQGAGEPEDRATVAGWFEAAATSGDLVAAFNLGLCFAQGVGKRQDEEQAARWLRKAADGVAEAQYMFGRLLLEGRGVAADPRLARI